MPNSKFSILFSSWFCNNYDVLATTQKWMLCWSVVHWKREGNNINRGWKSSFLLLVSFQLKTNDCVLTCLHANKNPSLKQGIPCIPAILDLSLNICLVFLNPELLPMAIELFLCAPLSYGMNCLFRCAFWQIYKPLNQDWRQCFLKWPTFRWAFALLFFILLCIFFVFYFFCSV